MLSIPWGKRTKIKKDIMLAESVLDSDHYGLDKVKERILEYLAVQQRLGHVKAVGGGDEHHLAEVVVDLQIVVVEGVVLFRIQHLQQGAGRVATPVGAHLVDLVEQEEGVGGLGLFHRLDDLAGHRADVGAAVAADLGLVTHAAEG